MFAVPSRNPKDCLAKGSKDAKGSTNGQVLATGTGEGNAWVSPIGSITTTVTPIDLQENGDVLVSYDQ